MNRTHILLGLAASVAFFAAACSDDETTPTTTSNTTVTTGNGTGGGTTTTTGNGGGTTTGVGGSGAGGATGSGGASSAAFCANYDSTCGFDMAADSGRFADEASCLDFFEAGDAQCVQCLEMHLGLASQDDPLHCPHACGGGQGEPCTALCGGTSGCQ